MSTLVLLFALIAPQDAGPASRPGAPTADEVRASIQRGVRFLLADQNKDGSFGGVRNMTFTDGFANPATHDAWVVGTTGLASTALLECCPKDEAQPALDRAAAFLASHADVKRPANWDIDNVWGFTFVDTSTVTVHVRRLREKVELDPGSPKRIQTVWGVGYRFEP